MDRASDRTADFSPPQRDGYNTLREVLSGSHGPVRESNAMAKKETSKTNVAARAEQKALASTCRVCGNKSELVMRVPSVGKRYMARLCCEKAGKA